MTQNAWTRYATGLLPAAGALFACVMVFGAGPASAQEAQDVRGMTNRITQLENQIQTLSQSVYRGKPLPPEMLNGTGNTAALNQITDRVAAVESQQRDLINQIEKLGFDLRQLQEQVTKAQADTDLRFQQMSGTQASASTPPQPEAAAALPADELAAEPAASTSGEETASTGDVKTSGTSTAGTLGTLSSSGAAAPSTPEALYETGFAAVREQKFDQAQKTFTTFMTKYPTHALAGNAQYWLGETYYVRGDFRQSAKMFAKGYQEFPKSQKAADCLLKLGLSLAKIGKKEDACLSLQQLQKEFPGDASPVNRRAKQEMTQLGCG